MHIKPGIFVCLNDLCSNSCLLREMPIAPSPIPLYRITHLDNLPHILAQGGLYASSSPLLDPGFKPIGNPGIISRRAGIAAPHPLGGTLSDFIPFYFGPRSPMLYQIAHGYNGVIKIPQEEIIYLVSTYEHVRSLGLTCFFTDGNAASQTTTFFTDDKDLSRVDWEAVYTRYWENTPMDLRRKEKKQAEVLVEAFVPLDALLYICVYNSTAKLKAEALLVAAGVSIPVKTDPSLYY